MATKKLNALAEHTSIATGDKIVVAGTSEDCLIDYDKLATAIINKWSTEKLVNNLTTTATGYALDASKGASLASDIASLKIKSVNFTTTTTAAGNFDTKLNSSKYCIVGASIMDTSSSAFYCLDGVSATGSTTWAKAIDSSGNPANAKNVTGKIYYLSI